MFGSFTFGRRYAGEGLDLSPVIARPPGGYTTGGIASIFDFLNPKKIPTLPGPVLTMPGPVPPMLPGPILNNAAPLQPTSGPILPVQVTNVDQTQTAARQLGGDVVLNSDVPGYVKTGPLLSTQGAVIPGQTALYGPEYQQQQRSQLDPALAVAAAIAIGAILFLRN